MQAFRNAKIQFLVATDVAARGLEIEGITHLFNYDIPEDVESYVHRIGWTGRAGQTGKAVTFATTKDRESLELIERGIEARIEKRSFNNDIVHGDGSWGLKKDNSLEWFRVIVDGKISKN